MGSSPSSNRVSAVSLQKKQELSCKGCEKLNDFEIRASELEKELENSQQGRLEVEAQHRQASDELGMLREELERLNKQLADSRASSASERATKQLVRRLESDLSTAKQELTDMKEHHKQQLQRVRASSAKSQAESALTVFELREENHRLTKENSKLLEQVHWCQREHREELPPDAAAAARSSSRFLQNQSSQLVIELSEQVATLSSELEQARQMISELQQQPEEETL